MSKFGAISDAETSKEKIEKPTLEFIHRNSDISSEILCNWLLTFPEFTRFIVTYDKTSIV